MTLEEKIEWDCALNIRELSLASGYSVVQLYKLGVRKKLLSGGKIRLSEFWDYFTKPPTIMETPPPRLACEGLVPLNDLRSIADKLSAPHTTYAPRAASRPRAVAPPRSSESRTSPSSNGNTDD